MKKSIITLAVIFAAITVSAQTVSVSDNNMTINIKKTAENTYHVDFKAGLAVVDGDFSLVKLPIEHKLTRQPATDGVYDCSFSIYFDELFDAYTIDVTVYQYTRENGWAHAATLSTEISADQYISIVGR